MTIPSDFDNVAILTSAGNTGSIQVIAWKLELGSTQTLGHQVGTNWVLNEIPTFKEQLAKCQEFGIELNPFGEAYATAGNGHVGNSDAYIFVPLPVTMRTKPTVSYSGSWVLEKGSSRTEVTGMTCDRLMSNGVLLKVTANSLTSGYYSLEANNNTSARLFLSADD